MALRRELIASVDAWAPTGTFKFDGSTSDLALQLYLRSQDGDEIAPLIFSSIPDTVTSRLNEVNVAFEDLDGFAQRAVLWDSGFAMTLDGDVKQIWTLNGLSMAEIALTLDEYEATNCTAFKCTQPDGTAGFNNNLCTGTEIFRGVKCVVEEHEQSNRGLAMWSVGGESTMIPEIELVKHTWKDGEDYKVYAVHTLDVTSERSYGGCPTTETYGYLNIPCYGTDDVPANELTVPAPSDWVTSWAQSFAANTDGGSSTGSSTNPNAKVSDSSASSEDDSTGTSVVLLGGSVGGALCLLLIIVLVALFVVARRRRKESESEDRGSPKAFGHAELVSPDPTHWDDQRTTVSTHTRPTVDDSLPRSGSTVPLSEYSWSNGGTNYSGTSYQPGSAVRSNEGNFRFAGQSVATRSSKTQETDRLSAPAPAVSSMVYNESTRTFGSKGAPPAYEEALRTWEAKELVAPLERIRGLGPVNALRVLALDSNVDRRRLPLDQVLIEQQLPMTTLQADSFIGRYNGQQVLLKRLAPSPNVNVAAVEEMAFEIQQRAHVRHPNLVHLIGAGWTSVHDLGMVVEFLPQGSLRTYLDRNQSSFRAWTTQKTVITGGIARALAYLHAQDYMHHDICAKNVLLTDKLEAKLASCGSTETSPFAATIENSRQDLWIAPEVLNGAPYSPAADIYSFGVLLTELDTCEMPYFDARLKSGDAVEISKIVALVKEGRLRPSFSAECPEFIRQLGEACCQQDPENRLTAQQIVQLLEGK
ncbi:TKL protein kinase [Phytophthora nicotianae P10297]|uniref:TKL protein kinase n=1 Tax=Phytophthora nicotianae P10297 TaxID=1317064 RepID=W2YJ49_PHYNI|nr:TKL protein kinase [Phytophthora nicotianae P10297]